MEKYQNLRQILIEVMADFLDDKYIENQMIEDNLIDPIKREDSFLHIRMAEKALNELINTCNNGSN